jgi:hypothetical protein
MTMPMAQYQTVQLGKGIANIKRQLALLYNKDHQLTVHDGTDKYRVALVIPSKPGYRYGEN